jgi:hypothetical protein
MEIELRHGQTIIINKCLMFGINIKVIENDNIISSNTIDTNNGDKLIININER